RNTGVMADAHHDGQRRPRTLRHSDGRGWHRSWPGRHRGGRIAGRWAGAVLRPRSSARIPPRNSRAIPPVLWGGTPRFRRLHGWSSSFFPQAARSSFHFGIIIPARRSRHVPARVRTAPRGAWWHAAGPCLAAAATGARDRLGPVPPVPLPQTGRGPSPIGPVGVPAGPGRRIGRGPDGPTRREGPETGRVGPEGRTGP